MSKGDVNRAGVALVEANERDAELPLEACEVAAKWRELHCDPLVWITTSVRGRVGAGVAYRLKRLPQIVAKLARATTMNLSQMQDLGGCRIVVGGNSDVDDAINAIERRASPWYEVTRITDYRSDGRPDTGYRAVHVIARREGFVLEIQVRTRRQHAWAEAVERAANRTGFKLKDGDGPADLVDYFRFASDRLAELDRGRALPLSSRKQFMAMDEAIAHHFPDLPPAEASTVALRDSRHPSSGENNWLLVYDWRRGTPYRWMDCGSDCVEAARTYTEWERKFPWRDGYEVVLIGSESRDTIEWTHAHYFGRSADDLDPHGVLQELRAA